MFYDCIEVVTEEEDTTYIKYYAPEIGLILTKAKTRDIDWFIFKELMGYETYDEI